jgi:hypothetical protein
MNYSKEVAMSKKSRSIESEIHGLFWRHYQYAQSSWVGGESTIDVTLSEQPKAGSQSEKVWHRKHCWSGTNLSIEINVSPRWGKKVRDRGLAVLDGLLTTHAGRVRRIDGIEVYPAAWVRQGRGFAIRPETGRIAFHRVSGTAYHLPGGTRHEAVSRLRRKLHVQSIPQEQKDARRRQRAQVRRARFERLVRRLASHDIADIDEVVVTRQDSLRAGNCEPGTDQFIETFFPDRRTATIADIAQAVGQIDLAVLDGERLTLARQIAAACLMAMRRARRTRGEGR